MSNQYKSSIGWIIKNVLLRNKIKVLFLILCIIFAILFGLLPPLVLEKVINMLVENKHIPLFLALLYFLFMAIGSIFDALKETMITVIGQKITHEIRSKMVEKLNRLPADYFSKNDSGNIASRFVGDVDTLEILFTSGIISMIVDVFKILSILFVIFLKSKGLGILMIVVTPLLYLFTRICQIRMLDAQIDYRKAVGQANQHIPETIKNLRTIHVLHKEKYMEKRYDAYIQKGFRAIQRSNFYDSIYSPVILVLSAIIISLMMILSVQGDIFLNWFGMSVGSAVAIIAYVGKVFDPLESLGMEIQNIQSAIAGIRRITDFLNEEEEQFHNQQSVHLNKSKPAVCISNCSFEYAENKKVLENFDCVIEKGENVTLFGRTGAGKSTLFKLILGLYSPTNGEIEVFGVPAKEIPNQQKRTIFGYVEQEFHAIPGTIADQISLQDPMISSDMIVNALKISTLYDEVMKLPDKELTEYHPDLFSQGQKQLLSIARAIVASPEILLLDEITANLDSNTEEKILQILQDASNQRTLISISHRLYGLMNSRKIEISTLK